MKNLKKITALLLVLVFCLALFACNDSTGDTGTGVGSNTGGGSTGGGSTNTPPPPQTGGTGDANLGTEDVIAPPEEARFADVIDMLTEMNIVVVDPYALGGTSSANRVTYQMVYDRLVYFDTMTGNLEPELALRWESDDQQTFTFYLREGVKFHNGDTFTAQDVVDSCLIAQANPGTLAFDQWKAIEHITAVNPTTVRMTLEAPDNTFVYNISLPGGAIINKRARDLDPVEGAWVGTGCFYVSDFISGNLTQLTRFDDYWGTKALTRVLNLRFMPEMAARAIALQNGEAHISNGIGPMDMDIFVDNPDFIVYGYPANTTHSLTFGLQDRITGDLNFRLAVAHALYRPDIAIASLGVWCKPTEDGAFWGDSTPFRHPNLPQREFNQDLARQYLEASVYNGEVIELIAGPDTLTIAGQMIQAQLQEVGINVELFATDVATLVGLTTFGNDRVQLLHFVSPYELNPASARVVLYPNMSANRGNYNNPEVNALLDEVITLNSDAEREAMYHRIQEIVYEDIPQLSLYERVWTVVTNSRVGGVRVNVDMNHDLRGLFMTIDG